MVTSRFRRQRRSSLRRRYDTDVVLSRGGRALPVQRVAFDVSPRVAEQVISDSSRGTLTSLIMWGPSSMDVQVGDRFVYDHCTYTVIRIRPGRQYTTIIDARAVQ